MQSGWRALLATALLLTGATISLAAGEFEAVCHADTAPSEFCRTHPHRAIALDATELSSPLYGVVTWDREDQLSIKQQYAIGRACQAISECQRLVVPEQIQDYAQLLAAIANSQRGEQWATRIVNIESSEPLKIIANGDNQLPISVQNFLDRGQKPLTYYAPATTAQAIEQYQAEVFTEVEERSIADNQAELRTLEATRQTAHSLARQAALEQAITEREVANSVDRGLDRVVAEAQEAGSSDLEILEQQVQAMQEWSGSHAEVLETVAEKAGLTQAMGAAQEAITAIGKAKAAIGVLQQVAAGVPQLASLLGGGGINLQNIGSLSGLGGVLSQVSNLGNLTSSISGLFGGGSMIGNLGKVGGLGQLVSGFSGGIPSFSGGIPGFSGGVPGFSGLSGGIPNFANGLPSMSGFSNLPGASFIGGAGMQKALGGASKAMGDALGKSKLAITKGKKMLKKMKKKCSPKKSAKKIKKKKGSAVIAGNINQIKIMLKDCACDPAKCAELKKSVAACRRKGKQCFGELKNGMGKDLASQLAKLKEQAGKLTGGAGGLGGIIGKFGGPGLGAIGANPAGLMSSFGGLGNIASGFNPAAMLGGGGIGGITGLLGGSGISSMLSGGGIGGILGKLGGGLIQNAIGGVLQKVTGGMGGFSKILSGGLGGVINSIGGGGKSGILSGLMSGAIGGLSDTLGVGKMLGGGGLGKILGGLTGGGGKNMLSGLIGGISGSSGGGIGNILSGLGGGIGGAAGMFQKIAGQTAGVSNIFSQAKSAVTGFGSFGDFANFGNISNTFTQAIPGVAKISNMTNMFKLPKVSLPSFPSVGFSF